MVLPHAAPDIESFCKWLPLNHFCLYLACGKARQCECGPALAMQAGSTPHHQVAPTPDEVLGDRESTRSFHDCHLLLGARASRSCTAEKFAKSRYLDVTSLVGSRKRL